jgi:transketolase
MSDLLTLQQSAYRPHRYAPRMEEFRGEGYVGQALGWADVLAVAENRSVIGRLGEAVAGLLMRSDVSTVFRQIGLPDVFLDAGAPPTLHDRYGISTTAMAATLKQWLN